MLKELEDGCFTVMVIVALSTLSFASVTTTLYVVVLPGATTILLVVSEALSHKYVYVDVPPLGFAVKVTFVPLQTESKFEVMPIVNCAFAFSLSAKENKINAKENKIIFDFLKNDCEVKCKFEDIKGVLFFLVVY